MKGIMGGQLPGGGVDIGGGEETVYGWCKDHVGCWTMPSGSTVSQCEAGIHLSCRGKGECSTTNGCPW